MTKRVVRWSKEVLIYSVLAIVIITGVDWYRTKDISRENAPALAGAINTGEYVDVISKSYEKPVIVYFWATWCSICRFVSPTIDWLSQYYPVIGISGSSGSDDRVNRYLEHKEYQFNNLNDQDSNWFQSWHISVTPTIAIVKDRQIASMTTGFTTPPSLLARIWFNQ